MSEEQKQEKDNLVKIEDKLDDQFKVFIILLFYRLLNN